MKRLMKKAEYEDFIQDWYNSWGTVPDKQIDQIIKDHPELAYNGKAWRWIGLKDIKNLILSNVELHDDENQNFLNYNEVVNIAKQQLRNDTRYRSWCQDYGDAETYAEKRIEEYGDANFGVIIESDITGLNYRDFLNKYDPDMAELANEENEVIGKSNNFQVAGLTIEQNGIMYLYDEDNPCEIYYDDNNIMIE